MEHTPFESEDSVIVPSALNDEVGYEYGSGILTP